MNHNILSSYYDSPIGTLQISLRDGAIISILPAENRPHESFHPLLDACKRELDAYFAGTLTKFSIPISFTGTSFQQEVWKTILDIPYGNTLSYQDVANKMGRPSSVRAVAHAISKNPILIVVPCHRIIGKDGSLTGFRAGIHHKKFLLELEKEH